MILTFNSLRSETNSSKYANADRMLIFCVCNLVLSTMKMYRTAQALEGVDGLLNGSVCQKEKKNGSAYCLLD